MEKVLDIGQMLDIEEKREGKILLDPCHSECGLQTSSHGLRVIELPPTSPAPKEPKPQDLLVISFLKSIYLFERERAYMYTCKLGRGREGESQVDSVLSAEPKWDLISGPRVHGLKSRVDA